MKVEDARIAYFDLETTGFSRNFDYIVEVAILSRAPERRPKTKKYHKYIEPPYNVPKGAARVHGIDEKFLKKLWHNKPEKLGLIKDVVKDIHRIFSEVDYSCAYNGVSFDIPFLHTIFKKYNLSIPKAARITRCIDPLLCLRYSGNKARVDERFKSLKLTDISSGLGRPPFNAHSAIEDTIELSRIFTDLIAVEILPNDIEELLVQQSSR